MTEELERLRQENADLRKNCEYLEAGMLEAQERFTKFFHASPHMMAISTVKEGRLVDLNEAAASLGGYRREELIGQLPIERSLFVDPNVADLLNRKMQEDGSVRNMEAKARTREGEIRTLLISADPITINEEPCILSTSIDITERERTAEALRESEERFRLIADNIDEIFWIVDTEKKCALYLSPAHEKIWGVPTERIFEEKSLTLQMIHPEDREKVMVGVASIDGGQLLDHEYRIVRPDGSIRYLLDRGFPIHDPSGKIKLYVGIGRDITEMKLAEAALRESREYLSEIINHIGDLIFVKDREHRFVMINEAFKSFNDIPAEKILGQSGMDQLPRELAEAIWKDEERVFETGEDSMTEDELLNMQGTPHLFITKKSRHIDKSGNMQLIGVMRDMTDYKQLEAQFLQSQKMEAIGLLAGGVAHDFNNLLNVINGYCELILAELDPQDCFRADLEQICEAGKRASTLTAQLLAFGRKQILKPEILNLNTVLTQMDAMLRRLIGEDIELITLAQPHLRLVNADFVQMQQIIMNLAVNARDAMPEGGKLLIETANADLDETYAQQHPLVQPGRYAMLAISDNGMGMDDETRSHLFEPFFTTKQKGRGTGLGLSTVYGIVQQSSGYIWVYSEPGQGTTFKICFPETAGTPKAPIEITEPELILTGSETLLVVEDEEAVRALAVRILREHGYTVLSASDGEEALRLAQAYKELIHMVLTDVIMPGISGNTLVTRLRISRPKIKSLFISGYTDEAIGHHGILDSGIAFLQKPFSIESLTRTVREVLES
jgi:PAS domain S-box-containing protein